MVDSISSPEGKWPVSYGSVVVISVTALKELLKSHLEQIVQTQKVPLESRSNRWIDDWTMQYLIVSSKHQSMYTSSDSAKWGLDSTLQ